MDRHIVIRSVDELHRLRGWSVAPTETAIRLDIANLEASERTWWEERLERNAFACGCEVGAAAVLVSLILWSIWLVNSRPSSPTAVLWLVVVAFAAATLGKLAGIALARFRLNRDLARLGDLMTRTQE